MTSSNLPAIAGTRAVGMPLAAPGAPGDEAGPDWRRIAAALWRFKWLVLLAVALGIGAGFTATRILSPEYVAQTTVWIDVPDRRGQPERGGPIRASGLFDADAWVDLLRSYVVLDEVVRNQRLYLELKSRDDTALFRGFGASEGFRPGDYRLSVDAAGQRYALATKDGILLEQGAVGDSIGNGLGFRWAPLAGAVAPGGAVRFSLATPRDAARRLGARLDVRMDMNGNFLSIELRGPDPRRIADILNAVSQRYVQVAAQLKRDKLTQMTKILDDQLNYARADLEDAEAQLQAFRVQTITLPSDQPAAPSAKGEVRDPAFASFFDKQLQRDQFRHDREAIERLLAHASDSGIPVGALSAIASVAPGSELSQALKELADKQAELRGKRYRYSDEHPEVMRLSAEIRDREHNVIPTLAHRLVAELRAREADLGRQVDASSRELRQIPPRAIEEARLRRRVDIAAALYTKLQENAGEARLAAEASAVPDVSILDPAIVPQRPVTNTTPRILLVALLSGLGLGVVAAIVLDRLDPRVRYPEQVSREMGLPILGAVPHLRDRSDPAEVVEALRGVCLNLQHAHGGGGPLVVTITSPGAGDGKSFLAANLAVTFADGGHRTLLVDGDSRRGVVHRRFNADRKPGLIDLLSGEVTREQIVRPTSYQRLDLVGCGTRTHRAPELLGSPAMEQFVAALRPVYDVILVDSPPLGAGVDPFILGTLTGNLVLVLRTGYSHREVAGAQLEVLDRLSVRTLGAVLNDVPPGAAYRYYSYYLPGYETSDEEDGSRRPAHLV